MNKFTIIIPTMWLCDHIYDMIKIYDNSNLVGEIIIIDNNPSNKREFISTKTKIVSKGSNIYVNPAWNWGVSLSQYENILIANDDVFISEIEFNNLIEVVSNNLTENIIIAPSPNCFNKQSNTEIKIIEKSKEFTYGFGTYMFLKRNSYTIIPNDILIFYGDNIQHDTNKPYLFEGVNIMTKMSVTVHHDRNLHALASLDHDKIVKYKFNNLKKI